ncbi:allantoicase [Saccharopolyspora sp. MS10]|uniref:allantoicase n=1 Tax=Saccharopolyspora sp. MS10 TaxID=3385973 RepID=UPI00399F728E
MNDRSRLPDLASRAVGGAVVHANDELFAERENLIKPSAPEYRPHTFGHKGQVYDGWETRRRREPGVDFALIRLGLPGIVRRLVVDTAFFKGNYPPRVSVQAAAVDGYPSPAELLAAEWTELLAPAEVEGDAENAFDVDAPLHSTHLRLCMHPDGGIARLRARGEPVADPRWARGEFDLAALEHGGRITGCSNMFYSSPANLLAPDRAAVMGEGWETARRRDDGNDWVEIGLAAPGELAHVELDTSHFVGNAPGWATLSGVDERGADPADPAAWRELLPRTRLQPDTRHRFRVAPTGELTRVRLDVHPDGGMARLRLHGTPTDEGRAELMRRWFGLLPAAFARSVLTGAGVPEARAAELAAAELTPEHVAELLAALG